jgi:hypothetical protein
MPRTFVHVGPRLSEPRQLLTSSGSENGSSATGGTATTGELGIRVERRRVDQPRSAVGAKPADCIARFAARALELIIACA